jgi:hypothetical protein
MTREEAKKLIMVICSTYPNYKPMDLTDTVNVWHFMLSDFEYNEISVALKAYILSDTSGFAPTVGQVLENARKIKSPEELNEMQAWALVSKALRNGTYGAEEEFNKLPPLVQQAVGSPSQLRNWATTDYESIENVIQSNFMRTYRTVCNRANEFSKLTPDILSICSNNIKNDEMTKLNTNDDKLKIEQSPKFEFTGDPMPKEARDKLEEMKRSMKSEQ